MDFGAKVVLITGGSSGIGLALAKEFAARGAFVVIVARHLDGLKRALAEIHVQSAGGKAAIGCDVSDFEQVGSMISEVQRIASLPDILINCAGVAHPGYVQELDLDIYRWMMETNYFGSVNVVKACLPGMIERGSGVIVNVGSLASAIGLIGYSAYSGSKFAIRGFTEALRMETKPYGIHVSFVMPPDTDTPQLTYENQFKPLELKYLLPEMGVILPEQVARAIIRGIEKGQYEILPDFGSKVILSGYRLFGAFAYHILDWLLKNSRARIARESRPER